MARSMCWHCQSKWPANTLRPLRQSATGIERPRLLHLLRAAAALAIDTQVLEAKFYELSRAFHPDFYQNKSDAEQSISLGNSAMLNTAYRTLRIPFNVPSILLDLEAGAVKDIRTSPPADLFEEILELQETLDEFRESDRSSNTPPRYAKLIPIERILRSGNGYGSQASTVVQPMGCPQDRGEATETARAERNRILKDMRDILSNRTYKKTSSTISSQRSPNPMARIVGIDLGTTNSLVAYMDSGPARHFDPP